MCNNKLVLFVMATMQIFLHVVSLQGQTNRPNIIYIMSDDHAYQAISAYGFGLNNTPNIDKLAKEGMLFNKAYVTNSICGPSRAVMLTGKYSHINGFKDNATTFDNTQTTVAVLLKNAGYQTAMIGKWHLVSDPVGFDYWNILPGQGDYNNPDFIENGVRTRRTGYVTNLTTDYAINWLNKRDVSKPFFLMYHQKAPHRNWIPDEKYYHLFDSTIFPVPANYFDTYDTRTSAAHEQEMEVARDMNDTYDLKLYYDLPDTVKGLEETWKRMFDRMTIDEKAKWRKAYGPSIDAFFKAGYTGKELALWKYQRYMKDYLRCVQSVDDNVGRLMQYLEDNDLDKNTIVIYTSDQGFYLGEHGWFDKRFMYEESFRTPLIVKWSGTVKNNSVSDAMILNLDYAETILDMADVKIPQAMQGKSFLPVLKQQQKGVFRDAVYYHYYETTTHHVAKHIGVHTGQYKLIYFYEKKEWELYDLKKDKAEMKNVYNDIAYSTIQAQLLKRLIELKKQYNDPDPENLK